MVTALSSLLSGRPVKHTVGMTGEVTLQGRVLPIGGLKQKVLAAHAAGLTDVVLPERNRGDLDEVPEEVREAMKFHVAMTIDEVLDVALEAAVGGVATRESHRAAGLRARSPVSQNLGLPDRPRATAIAGSRVWVLEQRPMTTITASQEHQVLEQVPTQLYIAGEWRDGGEGSLAVEDPATGEALVDVADASVEDAKRALDAAVEAGPAWAATRRANGEKSSAARSTRSSSGRMSWRC